MNDFGRGIYILDLSEKKEILQEKSGDRGMTFSPPADIFETGDGLHIVIEVPGVDVESLSVDVAGNRLIIAGMKEDRRIEGGAVFLCMERSYGRFRKTFEFTGAVNMLSARASYREGVLKIHVDRCEEKRGRGKKVKIEVDGD
ncbi:MAG: Hsp20 family protein [Deltaproteobacteria bacterium]|nr:Hsp20 family protein [Deltaproteobacteria bacterium]NIS77929.1 Hsp20 family protein [Deltaproteobacteria bacterium]